MSEETKSLAEQTADALIAHIIENKLDQNDKLPNEKELAELLGVGRSTLREAVRMLSSRNILEVRHGAGIFVSRNTGIADDPLGFLFIKDKKKLVADLVEFRMMVEPRIAALAAQNATPEMVQQLSALADAVEKKYELGENHAMEDAAFHAYLGTMSGNLLMPNLQPIIFEAIGMFIDMTHSRLKDETIQSHRAIVDAVRAKDATAAADAMMLHLVYNRVRLKETE